MAKDYTYRAKKAIKEQSLREFDDWNKDDLVGEIIRLRASNEELQSMVDHSDRKEKKEDDKGAYSEKNYKQEWSLPTKVAFLLHLNDRPLTSEDMHKQLLRLDHHYKDYHDPRTNLSTTLKRVSKSRRIIKIKLPGIKELIYALPEWVDQENKLLPDYNSMLEPFK